MIVDLSPSMIEALRRIGPRTACAADIGVNGYAMTRLVQTGFLSADTSIKPTFYSATERGLGAIAVLTSEPKPVEYERPVARIQREVSCHFGIPLIEMVSARRSRIVARPRQVAMYLAKLLTPQSLPDIGRRFGNRDHTTVIHAVRQVENLMHCLPIFRADVEFLRDKLQCDLCIPFVAEMSEEDQKRDAKDGSAKLLTAMLAIAA